MGLREVQLNLSATMFAEVEKDRLFVLSDKKSFSKKMKSSETRNCGYNYPRISAPLQCIVLKFCSPNLVNADLADLRDTVTSHQTGSQTRLRIRDNRLKHVHREKDGKESYYRCLVAYPISFTMAHPGTLWGRCITYYSYKQDHDYKRQHPSQVTCVLVHLSIE